MLCVNRNNTIQGFGNAVDTKGLRLTRIIRLCFYQPFFPYFRIERSCYWVFHYALISSISLFRYLTREGVGECANAEGGKVGCICLKENRNHTITHLGIISMLVMPPSKEMVLLPG